MKTIFEKTMEEIEAKIDTPFVTATFGENWPQYARDNMDKEDLIRIAWKQGRKAILLERKLAELLQIKQFIKDNEPGRGSKWISVKDDLPEVGTRVLIYEPPLDTINFPEHYLIAVTYYAGRKPKNEKYWYRWPDEYSPTHWMPLPVPPNSDTNAQECDASKAK